MDQLAPISKGINNQSPPALVGAFTEFDTATLNGLCRIFLRRWKIATCVTAGTFLLGVLICLLIVPRYSSTNTIEINKDDITGDTTASKVDNAAVTDDLKTEIQTDISILQSDGLALAVIRDLGLLSKSPFRAAVVEEERNKALDQAPVTRQKAIRIFEKNLKVESPEDTRLINVTFSNPNAAVAAEVANALSRLFIEDTLQRRQSSTIKDSYWLQKQLAELKKQVERSEQELANYQRKTGLAGIQLSGSSAADGATSVTISPHSTVTERLFSLNQELNAAEINRISTEAVYQLVKSKDPEVVLGLGSMSISNGTGGGTGAVAADGGISLVRALRAQEASLSQDYAAGSVKYGANNPRLVQLQQQMDAIRQQMRAELERISERANNSYLYAKRNEDSIREQFARQQQAANLLADETVQLQVLAQEAYSNRALYESLFSKLQTASLASGVRATRIDVVDSARPGGYPTIPPYEKVLPALAVVSMLFGISSSFLRESLDETVRTSRNIREVADFPILEYVPRLEPGEFDESDARTGILIQKPKSSFSEAFRALRTSIILETESTLHKVIMVASALRGDGKTTITYNLGVSFAQQGARVLIVDGDLRHPDLHNLFQCAISPGLGDVDASLDEKIVSHSKLPTLSILPAGRRLEFPAEFFSSNAFTSILESCSRDFDYILIDSPAMSVADASIIASKSEGIIAILRSRRTTRSTFAHLLNSLLRTGTPVIGVVLNQVRRPSLDGFPVHSGSEKDSNDHFKRTSL